MDLFSDCVAFEVCGASCACAAPAHNRPQVMKNRASISRGPCLVRTLLLIPNETDADPAYAVPDKFISLPGALVAPPEGYDILTT
jgi:hypothetical protein